MTLSSRAAATAVASLLLVGSAVAQSTAPAAAPPASTSASTKAPVMHTETSLKCSKEADTKGLHGKERKKFRSECKKMGAKPS